MVVDPDLVGEFDADVWAREFVARSAVDPTLATNVHVMRAWFANAIMAGFDEGQRRMRPSGDSTGYAGSFVRWMRLWLP